VHQNRPPNNNNAPARYFLLFYSGPVLLLAAEGWLSGPPRNNNAPARYFLLFYSGSVLFARRRKLAFPPNQRSGSILRCLLRRIVRVGPGAFSSEKSDPRGVPETYQILIAKHIDSLIFLPFGPREGCQVSNESGGPD
jgi:hypothetical protein